jgi:myo-inositol-1(or 4)-monophosphatase
VQVQEAIVSSLLSDFPASGILAEEGPEDAPMPVDAEHLWIVDPICGSLNFAQGIPYFGLSVALRSEGAIRVGVVYDPCRDELFAATSDTQATLNGRHISVHHVLEGSEAWAAAVVGTDWPHTGEARGHTRLVLDAMVDQVTGCTLMGSPALGICNVAAGRLHAYWHLDLKIWDFAAAGLILQRAGGILTDARGNSWIHSEGGYIASNMVIHGWTLNCIRAVLSHEEGLKAQRLARGAEGQASAPQP